MTERVMDHCYTRSVKYPTPYAGGRTCGGSDGKRFGRRGGLVMAASSEAEGEPAHGVR